ncbi:MAG: DUF4340 domain-containing protein [Treponema sp.]|jgi:hypothetical protein|nr:DUF4340 domain-containing protein [Treponema sp.]
MYKKKLIFLLSLIAVLALLYAGSMISNSGFFSKRDSFAWMDSNAAERAGRIIISTSYDGFELVKQNNVWFVLYNQDLLPARQVRVQDFFTVLTTRSEWPVRSSNAYTHERFGLDDRASRIIVYAGGPALAAASLLDLLIGNNDFSSGDTYFRRFDQNEVHSGDSSINLYLSSVNSWFNLRLFPDGEINQIDVDSVQRLSVRTPYESQVFSRSGRGWIISGIDVETPSVNAIESYIRTILTTEGDGFIQPEFNQTITPDDFNHYSISMEFGNAAIVTIRLTEADETDRRFARVSGSGSLYGDHIYSIPAWPASRLFRDAESFESD